MSQAAAARIGTSRPSLAWWTIAILSVGVGGYGLFFVLTFGAVTLRVLLPIGAMTVGFETTYPIIAWMAWVPNLILAEIRLRRRHQFRTASTALAAQGASSGR